MPLCRTAELQDRVRFREIYNCRATCLRFGDLSELQPAEKKGRGGGDPAVAFSNSP